MKDAPFLPALNQIESSATSTMTYDVSSGVMVGTLTTSAPSVTVIPTSLQLSGWPTPQPGDWAQPDPFGANTSPTIPEMTVVSVTVTTVPKTSPTARTEFGNPFVPITVSRDPSVSYSMVTVALSAPSTSSSSSASATGSGGAPILGYIGGVEMLALIVVVLSSVVSYV